MNSDLFPKVVLLIVIMNIVSISMGIPMYDDGGDVQTATNRELNYTNVSVGTMSGMNYTAPSGVIDIATTGVTQATDTLGWIVSILGYLLTGGVTRMLASMGMDVTIQWLIGAPISVIVIFSGLMFFKELSRK